MREAVDDIATDRGGPWRPGTRPWSWQETGWWSRPEAAKTPKQPHRTRTPNNPNHLQLGHLMVVCVCVCGGGVHSPLPRRQPPHSSSLATPPSPTLSAWFLADSYKFCAPTRSALQSGRLPVHVNVVNAEPECVNPKDPVSGFAGIPVNMSTLPAKMAGLGC